MVKISIYLDFLQIYTAIPAIAVTDNIMVMYCIIASNNRAILSIKMTSPPIMGGGANLISMFFAELC